MTFSMCIRTDAIIIVLFTSPDKNFFSMGKKQVCSGLHAKALYVFSHVTLNSPEII